MEGTPGEEKPRTSPMVMYPNDADIASSSCRKETRTILIVNMQVIRLLASNLWLMQISSVIYTIREVMISLTCSAIPDL
jgi:hypothetical protein